MKNKNKKLQEELESIGMINNVDKLNIEDGIRGSAQMALSTALKDSQRHRRAAKEMNDNQEAEAKKALSREISNKEHPEPLDYLKPNSQIELKESLFESVEDTADTDDKVFKVTYKESPEIFSAVMIKASDEDEAKEKLSAKKPGKIIVGVEIMSDEAVKDMTSRGMSLMEAAPFDHHDPDSKEPDGSEPDPSFGKFDKSVDELNKALLASEESLREDANSSEEELPVDEKECIEEIPVAAEEEQPSSELILNGIANELSALIKDEWEAIEGYKSTIVNLQSIGGYDEIVSVLKEIAGEEYVHVGQLQRLSEIVAPQADKIADGQEEAEKQLAGESGHSEGE